MPVQARTVRRIEWRLQDVDSGKIFNRVYPNETRAQWHANRFNHSGKLFNSPLKTQVVRVAATYGLETVQTKQPLKLKVLSHGSSKTKPHRVS